MKATALLKQQHREVEDLFSRIQDGEYELLNELANKLAGHMAIEQEIFYPAVRSIARDAVSEAFEEHSIAELALKRALEVDEDDEQHTARIKVLKELILQHVQEEEGELLPKVEKTLSEADLEELAEQMQTRFDEVVAVGYEATLPEGLDETSADLALEEADEEEEGDDEAGDEEESEASADEESSAPAAKSKKAKRGPAHPSR